MREALLCSIDTEWAIWREKKEYDDEPGVETSCGAEAMVIMFPLSLSPSPSP